ncbi:MAG TPA: GTPase ObgE [Acidobacteriota bacterium]|nr:GTPase ObgE [Acidobacteriota bacterium]
MFIDRAKIKVIAGGGGNGCLAFRREKSVPRGGPSGGDGGRGGDIYLECSDRVNTLLHFQYKRLFKAQRGAHGEGDRRHGKDGESITILIPPGTQVFTEPEHELLRDFAVTGDRLLVAAGGRGGRGNAQFATPTNQAPRRTEPGLPGEELDLSLSLKLIADVGLVGFPNAGKSTLIARISSAKPKIADYPFTTLVPNLGVVQLTEYRSFVVADIPGLIEGAHEGHGLGDQFLKHVERTKILVHVVDISETGRDPVTDYRTILHELELFNEDLSKRSQLVVASKIDVLEDPKKITRLKLMCRRRRLPFLAVSAVSGAGIPDLIGLLARLLGI